MAAGNQSRATPLLLVWLGVGGVIPSAANLLFPRQPSCTHTHLLAQRADWQEEPCSSLSEKVQRHRFINTNSPCSEFQAGWVLTGVYLGELVLISRNAGRGTCPPQPTDEEAEERLLTRACLLSAADLPSPSPQFSHL